MNITCIDRRKRLLKNALSIVTGIATVVMIMTLVGCGQESTSVTRREAVKVLDRNSEELRLLLDQIPRPALGFAQGKTTEKEALAELEDIRHRISTIKESIWEFVPSPSADPKCNDKGIQKGAETLLGATALMQGATDFFITGLLQKRFDGPVPNGVRLISHDYPFRFERNGVEIRGSELADLYLEEIMRIGNDATSQYSGK